MNNLRWYLATLMLAATLASSASADPMAVQSIEKDVNGLTLKLRPGILRLEVCSGKILRVSYSPTEKMPARQDFSVIKQWPAASFDVREDDKTVTLATEGMNAKIDRTTGAMTFTDASGQVFLQESPAGGKKLTPTVINGESTFTVEQSFVSPPDEHLYGMSQSQDGIWNWRGIPIELRQQNTQTAIPVLVSSKGYGLLWNNASMTEFNPVDDEVQLKAVDAAAKTDAGANATEQINNSSKTKEQPLPVRDGTFTSGAEGDYVFFAKNGDRKRALLIEVDGKRIGGFESFWVPYTAVGTVHLVANKTCSIKVIGGGSKVKLFARPLGDTTTFRSQVGDAIDYYVFYGPKLDDVIAGVRTATGDAPMWPKWAFGFWQCRERYSSQQQILDAVAEFRKRKIPLDLLVQDWQYWGKHGWGAYQWDQSKYPDPQAMIDKLHDQNTKFMISVWSNPAGAAHEELATNGLLIHGSWVDAFNAKAREMRWKYIDDAFFKIGTDAWWQDATEPGDDGNALNEAKTSVGSGNRVRNAYPLFANQTVYEGQRQTTDAKRVVILTRSFYPGQQRYASALWSGDIASTWDAFRRQIPAGLNACMTGLPYWTTDCGGFFRPKGQYTSDDFNELLVRWFQWSTFCPILRIHGFQTETEMWKFPKAYDALLKYDHLRYRLLPYNYSMAWQVTDKGYTIMRALPLDFPADAKAAQIGDEYMHGPAFLVSPVTTPQAKTRKVYLPGDGQWINFWTGKREKGGQEIEADAPLDTIPLFVRSGSIIPLGPDMQYATQSPADPIELRVYPGADGAFTLYDDEGDNYNYEKGQRAVIPIVWDHNAQTLTIGKRSGSYPGMAATRTFKVVWVTDEHGVGASTTENADVTVQYAGEGVNLKMPKR
jgi:alpha-D-xyloside xylohydrolase